MKKLSVPELEAAVLTKEESKAVITLIRERGTPDGWVMPMLDKVGEISEIIEHNYPEPRTPDKYQELQELLNHARPIETEVSRLLRFKDEDSIAGKAIRKLISIVKPDFE
jgi:hypothetical protein